MQDPVEIEPGGITYDRIRTGMLLDRLVTGFGLRSAVEVPAFGAKAAPGLYSLSLGALGLKVLLVSPGQRWEKGWKEAGAFNRVSSIDARPDNLPIENNAYDLAWNFVTLSRRHDFVNSLRELRRVASKCVMTIHCNGRNIGHPWHQFLHRQLNLAWTHGSTEFMYVKSARRAYAEAGLHVTETGYLDMPPWPDPPGFRDVRLHRASRAEVEESNDLHVEWRAPITDIIRGDPVPAWLKALSFVENLPVPSPVRRRFSHLFYVIATP